MPCWTELIRKIESLPDDNQRAVWLNQSLQQALLDVRHLRGDRNVIFYSSAFLQKPGAPASLIQITHEDLNGFMAVMFGMKWDRGLTLILHTPGGVTNAAESIVSYLWSKFENIEVIVPTFAMSAGTMISLSSQCIVMGRQSQLGPIDPQLPIGGRFVSARAVVDQFEAAKKQILSDRNTAHLWAPILPTMGPALLEEARNALDYGEHMVATWLRNRMFAGNPDAAKRAEVVAKHFNDGKKHMSHGRRIDRDEARAQGLNVESLETDQKLQESVLTAYHLVTILMEKSPAAKVLTSDAGRAWIKNVNPAPKPQGP